MKGLWLKLIILCLAIIFIKYNFSSLTKTSTSLPVQNLSAPTDPTPSPVPTLHPPIENAKNRVTKKPFGIYVTPQNSPIKPEHFTGYHTGVDFEIFDTEKDAAVKIYAICDGPILEKRTATGYGGILIQSCQLNDQPVTIIYGHLKLSSITQKTGDQLKAGDNFAILGNAYSSETGGERKHLHLGIKKGTAINILGYVQQKNELDGWIDYQTLPI